MASTQDTPEGGRLFRWLCGGKGPEAERAAPGPGGSYSRILITTRRFWARFSRDLLSTAGLDEP